MPTASASRRIPAPAEELWRIVSDPYHLPRWWPRVTRVEAVTEEHFTEVLATQDGRSLRADFRVVESRAPERRVWEQELEGTPFERVFAALKKQEGVVFWTGEQILEWYERATAGTRRASNRKPAGTASAPARPRRRTARARRS